MYPIMLYIIVLLGREHLYYDPEMSAVVYSFLGLEVEKWCDGSMYISRNEGRDILWKDGDYMNTSAMLDLLDLIAFLLIVAIVYAMVRLAGLL